MRGHRQHRIEVVLRREGPDERDDLLVAQTMLPPELGDLDAGPKPLQVDAVVDDADLALMATNDAIASAQPGLIATIRLARR
jgi:hypothetical protein